MTTASYQLVDAPRQHPGWAVLRQQRLLGSGRAVFDEAVRRFHAGEVHRAAGVRCRRDGEKVRVSIMGVPNYCRVIFERHLADEFAYTYRATERHLETGEESFAVRMAADGTVHGFVTAISRPDCAGVRFLQRLAARRYLAGFSAS